MVHWGWLVLVLYIGAALGFFLCALLSVSRLQEENE
jgi:hypothetical protein